MSRENVEVVRDILDRFQAGLDRGDPGAAFDSDALANDAEWIPPPEIPGPSSYRGRDGFVEFMHVWTEDFERWSLGVERLIDAGDDRVIALLHQSATGKGSGAPVELHYALVYELKDGRVIRMRNYLSQHAALEAVGLRE
jgi:ketosteroid isomerase-like protein